MNPNDRSPETEPLGSSLRRARLAHDVPLAVVEEETKIRASYIAALEEGRFDELPPDIYMRRILRSLCYYYGLDADAVWSQFAAAREAYARQEAAFARLNLGRTPAAQQLGAGASGARVLPMHRIAALGAAGVVLLFLSGYVVHQAQSFSAAPQLAVMEPGGDIAVAHRTIYVRGTAESGAKVTINNQEVLTDESGHFEVPYGLSRGENVITVVAEKKNGKSTRLSRTVAAEYPEPVIAEAPKEGFLATVTAAAPTWVRVRLDGSTSFEGLISPEEGKTFRGKEELQVRTGNAGATRIAINGRDQGAVGREGQVASYVYTNPRTVGLAD